MHKFVYRLLGSIEISLMIFILKLIRELDSVRIRTDFFVISC